MGVKLAKVQKMKPSAAVEQELQDKKLKGQLAVREELYGKSAKATAQAEKQGNDSRFRAHP